MFRQRSALPLLISLLVGALFHLWVFRQPLPEAWYTSDSNPPDAVEVEKWDETKSHLPIVQTERASQTRSSKAPAQFGGEFTQRVDQQTRAPRAGPLQRQRGGTPSDPDGIAESPNSLRMDELLTGASPNVLPDDIRLGNQTVLNTEAVLHASFMNRLADAIYVPWSRNAIGAIQSLQLAGVQLQPKTYITKLAITLDTEGYVIEIETLTSSGVPELDEAPRRAFWDRDPFPNPPLQLEGEKGTVRFTYEFHFELGGSKFRIIPWSI